MSGGGDTPSLFTSAGRSLPQRPEFTTLKRYSIFSLARALGKLHKKIPKTILSLCILPIEIWVII